MNQLDENRIHKATDYYFKNNGDFNLKEVTKIMSNYLFKNVINFGNLHLDIRIIEKRKEKDEQTKQLIESLQENKEFEQAKTQWIEEIKDEFSKQLNHSFDISFLDANPRIIKTKEKRKNMVIKIIDKEDKRHRRHYE